MKPLRRALLVAGLSLLAGCATSPSADPSLRQALAPTGTLRIAVYPGSPTSMVKAPGGDEMRGLSVEIGREMARRLGVPSEVLVFQRVAEVVEALQQGRADMTITNATPARARDVDFTPPLIALELGYLSLPGSPVQSLAEVDRPGVRIGVSQGSSSQGALSRDLRQASVVPVPSLQVAARLLRERELDAFATNKAILFELADNVPGAHVLDGRWGLEHLALAVPQGRQAAAPWLREFAEAMKREGRVKDASARAGLRRLHEP